MQPANSTVQPVIAAALAGAPLRAADVTWNGTALAGTVVLDGATCAFSASIGADPDDPQALVQVSVPPKGIGVASMVGWIFGADLPALATTFLNQWLGTAPLDLLAVTVDLAAPDPAATVTITPAVRLGWMLAREVTLLDGHVVISAGSLAHLDTYTLTVDGVDSLYVGGGLDVDGVVCQQPLHFSTETTDAQSWSIALAAAPGTTLPSVDTMLAALTASSARLASVTAALRSFGMIDLTVDGICVGLTVPGAGTGGPTVSSFTITATAQLGSATVTTSVDFVAETAWLQLASPVAVTASSLSDGLVDEDLTLTLSSLDALVQLAPAALQAFVTTSLDATGVPALNKVLTALGGQGQVGLVAECAVSTAPAGFFLSLRPGGAALTLPGLATALGLPGSPFAGSPFATLGVTVPALQVGKQGDAWSLAVAGTVVDTADNDVVFGELVLEVSDAATSATAWNFGLGVACAPEQTLTALVPGLSDGLPSFVTLDRLYAVFATTPTRFAFAGVGGDAAFVVPIGAADSFACGAAITVDKTSLPGKFLADNLGIADLALQVAGTLAVGTSKYLLLDLTLQAASTFTFASAATKKYTYPRFEEVSLSARLIATEVDVTLGLVGRVTVSLQDTLLRLTGAIDLQVDSVGLAFSLDTDQSGLSFTCLDIYVFDLQSMFLSVDLGFELVDPGIGIGAGLAFTSLSKPSTTYQLYAAFMLSTADPQNFLATASFNQLPTFGLPQLVADLCPAAAPLTAAFASVSLCGVVNCTFAAPTGAAAVDLCKQAAARIVPTPLGAYRTDCSQPAGPWFLTDDETATIYQVEPLADGTVTVTRELQLYICPAQIVTATGQTFPQALRISGQLRVLDFAAQASLDVTSNGLSGTATCSPVSFGALSNGQPAVTLTSTGDATVGPTIRLDVETAGASLKLDGQATVLSATARVSGTVDGDGVSLQLAATSPIGILDDSVALGLTSAGWTSMRLTGKVSAVLDHPAITVDGYTVLPAIVPFTVSVTGTATVAIGTDGDAAMTLGATVQSGGTTLYTFATSDAFTIASLADSVTALQDWFTGNASAFFTAAVRADRDMLGSFLSAGLAVGADAGQQIALALRDFCQRGLPDAASDLSRWVNGASSYIDSAAYSLYQAFVASGQHTANELAAAVHSSFGASESELASACETIWGASGLQPAADALQSVFGSSDVANVAAALAGTFSTAPGQLASALKSAFGSLGMDDMARALVAAFGAGDVLDIAKALISTFSISVWNAGQVVAALTAAGVSVSLSTIEGLF